MCRDDATSRANVLRTFGKTLRTCCAKAVNTDRRYRSKSKREGNRQQYPRTKRRTKVAKRRGAPVALAGHSTAMQASLLLEFRARRFSIRARWEVLLRAEPVTTPLGNPDALVHLIDTTMEELLSTLDRHVHAGRTNFPPVARPKEASCPCGRNPLLAYFAAAEQALREGLILAQAASAPIDPAERDLSVRELDLALSNLARREIEAFCGVCQFRHLALPAPVQMLAICGG